MNRKTNVKPAKTTLNNASNDKNKCQLCPLTVTGKMRPGLSCCHCNKLFHASCLEIAVDSLQSLKSIDVNWACKNCKMKSRRSTIFVPSSPDNLTRENSTEQTNQSNNPVPPTMRENLAKLQEFQTTAETSLQFFSNQLEDVLSEIVKLKESVEKLDKLTKENESHKNTIKLLESKLATIEQHQNDCDLIITGIPEMEKACNSTTQSLVKQFSDHIGYQLDDAEIKFCNRLPHLDRVEKLPSTSSAVPTRRPAKILVKFHSTIQKESLKRHIRTYKKSHKTVKFKESVVNYYACDHLSKNLNNLFNAAKSTATTKNYNYVWVSESKILVKKCNNSPVITIKTLEDLNKIK